MQFETSKLTGNITLVTLNGRLDLEGTQAIEQTFAFATTTRADRIVVDLAGVSFISSIGLRMLLTSAKAQANRGGKLVLAGADPAVRKVLEMSGIDQLIPLCESIAEAGALLGA